MVDLSVFGGKHAVVTGGARGIGAGIASALTRAGARISVISRAPADVPPGVVAVRADVGDESSVRDAFARVRAANGPVAVLVNNAGISDSAPLERTSLELFERIVRINLTGTFLCTREAIGEMRAAGWGRVLNVASIAGLGGAPYIAAYCASKHAVVGLTRAAATELADAGITVNAICPGYTETDMMQQAVEKITTHTGASDAAARETLARMNPLGRLATVEEVADAALALMSGEKTGVSVVIPGGAEA